MRKHAKLVGACLGIHGGLQIVVSMFIAMNRRELRVIPGIDIVAGVSLYIGLMQLIAGRMVPVFRGEKLIIVSLWCCLPGALSIIMTLFSLPLLVGGLTFMKHREVRWMFEQRREGVSLTEALTSVPAKSKQISNPANPTKRR